MAGDFQLTKVFMMIASFSVSDTVSSQMSGTFVLERRVHRSFIPARPARIDALSDGVFPLRPQLRRGLRETPLSQSRCSGNSHDNTVKPSEIGLWLHAHSPCSPTVRLPFHQNSHPDQHNVTSVLLETESLLSRSAGDVIRRNVDSSGVFQC